MKCLKYLVLFLLVLNSLQSLGQQLRINSSIPHYLVQGDHIEFKVELSNVGDRELTGQVQLELTDSLNHQSVDGWLMNTFPNQYFTIAVGKKETVSFPIQIPVQFNRILKWKVSARTGSNTDTMTNHTLYQEGVLPVLTNRVGKSESYSLIIKDTAVHQFQIKKLSTSGTNEAIENRLLQVEVSCDPSLFALVSMPEIVYQNRMSTAHLSESFFAACVLASSNEPTVLHIDKLKLNADLKDILSAIKVRQMKSGAFPWITSGSEDLKSTIDFLTVAGRLKYLNAVPENIKNELNNIIDNALRYTDQKVHKMITDNKFNTKKWLSYFYMTSFYPRNDDVAFVYGEDMFMNIVNNPKQIINKSELLGLNIYLYRSEKITLGKKLLSKIDPQDYAALPVDQLSLLLELYRDMHVNYYFKIGDVIKFLLQKRKENRWEDASSTLAAFFSLKLLTYSLKMCEPLIHLQIGSIHLYNTKEVEGKPISYFRKTIDGSFIKPEMGSISISIQNTQQLPDKKAYTTAFWNYIDESEKGKSQKNIRISKTLTGKNGPLTYSTIQLGDTIQIKLELVSDRDYDHVELTDLPAAGVEPLIESGTSSSIYNHHSFFYLIQLKKGKNVFEYRAVAKHTGTYNFGVTELSVPDRHIKIESASHLNLTIE